MYLNIILNKKTNSKLEVSKKIKKLKKQRRLKKK
jgi:hypothetical protein